MTTLRFSFPTPPAAPSGGPAFAVLPAVVACQFAPGHAAVVQQLYQAAWERTQAVLAPSPVEKLYRVSVN